jgi:predicted site-specific integrase-resolvase
MDHALPRLCTAQEVALWLTCPTRQVIRWAKEGRLPCITLPDGERMFDPSELAAWMQAQRKAVAHAE